MASDEPQFSFGVIADIQYADIEDGHNYARTVQRFYRGSLDMLQRAMSAWQADMTGRPVFLLQLGDIIDGHNRRHHASDSALRTVLDKFCQFAGPVYHVWGNHEYYNFSRQTLLQSRLYSGHSAGSTAVAGAAYYAVQPHPQLRILVLDCYEISLIGSSHGTPEYEAATRYLHVNPNSEKNSAKGLLGDMCRFVKFNGAVSDQQLAWMEENLEAARDLRQNVIVAGHCSVYTPSSSAICTCWNGAEIMCVLQQHCDVVLCYFAGHNHHGGLAADPAGVLHVTMPGVVENAADADFGTVHMYTEQLVLEGRGRVPRLTLPLKFPLL